MRRGHTIGYAECTITDEENRLVAKAASTCMASSRPEGRRTIIFLTLPSSAGYGCLRQSGTSGRWPYGASAEAFLTELLLQRILRSSRQPLCGPLPARASLPPNSKSRLGGSKSYAGETPFRNSQRFRSLQYLPSMQHIKSGCSVLFAFHNFYQKSQPSSREENFPEPLQSDRDSDLWYLIPFLVRAAFNVCTLAYKPLLKILTARLNLKRGCPNQHGRIFGEGLFVKFCKDLASPTG